MRKYIMSYDIVHEFGINVHPPPPLAFQKKKVMGIEFAGTIDLVCARRWARVVGREQW